MNWRNTKCTGYVPGEGNKVTIICLMITTEMSGYILVGIEESVFGCSKERIIEDYPELKKVKDLMPDNWCFWFEDTNDITTEPEGIIQVDYSKYNIPRV